MAIANQIICGDAFETLATLASNSVALTITSPPYYRQRDYGVADQIGLEDNLTDYLKRIEDVLVQLLRVTNNRGSCFCVVGDTYVNRQLLLVPHRIGILAQDVGWTVRNDVIWRKTSPPPERAGNRWRTGHEHVFFLAKQPTGYRFNTDVVRVPHSAATRRRWGGGQKYGGAKSKNRKNLKDSKMRDGQVFELNPNGCIPTDVWSFASANTSANHYAAFPLAMIGMIIEACTEPGELVLDPFVGSGTTCVAAASLRRQFLGIELNPDYATAARAAVAECFDKIA